MDDQGQLTGHIEPLSLDELPLRLPELADYKPSGKPEPPLGKATDWVFVTRNGKRSLLCGYGMAAKRVSNTSMVDVASPEGRQ